MLLYTWSASVGEVGKAPVMVRRHWFWTLSSFLRCVGAAFSKVMEPYSRMGLMSDVYSVVSVALSPPHCVPVRALRMFVRFSALPVMSVMCCLNVKCLSKVMPRNLAVSAKGICVLLSVKVVVLVRL